MMRIRGFEIYPPQKSVNYRHVSTHNFPSFDLSKELVLVL
jgi:hypothetical protein